MSAVTGNASPLRGWRRIGPTKRRPKWQRRHRHYLFGAWSELRIHRAMYTVNTEPAYWPIGRETRPIGLRLCGSI